LRPCLTLQPDQRRDRNQHLSRSQRHSRRSAPAGLCTLRRGRSPWSPPEGGPGRGSAGWTHCWSRPTTAWRSAA